MKINREIFLRTLEAVAPGLKPPDKSKTEQYRCFVFEQGQVRTYNEEIACNASSGLDENIKAAVRGDKLLNILRKSKDEFVAVSIKDNLLWVKGEQGRKSWHTMESQIDLPPLDELPDEGSWKPLPEGWLDAMDMVTQCVAGDGGDYTATCVNIHPEWLESGDEIQFCRWNIPTPIQYSTLVRGSSLKYLKSNASTQVAETNRWLHFKNASGCTLSCSRSVEEYPTEELTKIFAVQGDKLYLPPALAEEALCAEEFSSENAEQNFIGVTISPDRGGLLRLEGVGTSGGYSVPKRVLWTGPEMKFYIAPKLLAQLVEKHQQFSLAPTRLKVSGANWVYVACLRAPNVAGGGEQEESQEVVEEVV